jgi:hypothetical protein
MDDKRTDKNSETPVTETCQPNETKQVNIDFRELVVSLIIEVEVLKKCLVENKMITSEDFIKDEGEERDYICS